MDRQISEYSFFSSRTPITQATRRAVAPRTGRMLVRTNILKGALS